MTVSDKEAVVRERAAFMAGALHALNRVLGVTSRDPDPYDDAVRAYPLPPDIRTTTSPAPATEE